MFRRLEGDLLEAGRRNKGSLIGKAEENMRNASALNQESAYSRYVLCGVSVLKKILSTNTPKFLEANSGDLKMFFG